MAFGQVDPARLDGDALNQWQPSARHGFRAMSREKENRMTLAWVRERLAVVR
jgi:hypothetical protein